MQGFAGRHLDMRFYSCHKPSAETRRCGRRRGRLIENESEAKIKRRNEMEATQGVNWMSQFSLAWSKGRSKGPIRVKVVWNAEQ